MNKLLAYIIFLVALSGCTHNNGDIGDLFGTWRLDRIVTTADDGSVASEEVTDVFWAFQNRIIMMERVLPYHETTKRYGTWSRQAEGAADDVLLLSFGHSDDNREPGTSIYRVLSGIYLPDAEHITLRVRRLDGSQMTLEYQDPEAGLLRTYYFTKW